IIAYSDDDDLKYCKFMVWSTKSNLWSTVNNLRSTVSNIWSTARVTSSTESNTRGPQRTIDLKKLINPKKPMSFIYNYKKDDYTGKLTITTDDCDDNIVKDEYVWNNVKVEFNEDLLKDI